MKHLFYLIICVLLFSCNPPSKRYIENNNAKSVDTLIISFDYDNIIDIIYSPEDNCVFIEYDDADCFDYDNLAYLTNRKEWYGEYIAINLDEILFNEFLKDYYSYDYTANSFNFRNDRLNDKYRIIQRKIIYNDSIQDFVFDIIKYNTLKCR